MFSIVVNYIVSRACMRYLAYRSKINTQQVPTVSIKLVGSATLYMDKVYMENMYNSKKFTLIKY